MPQKKRAGKPVSSKNAIGCVEINDERAYGHLEGAVSRLQLLPPMDRVQKLKPLWGAMPQQKRVEILSISLEDLNAAAKDLAAAGMERSRELGLEEDPYFPEKIHIEKLLEIALGRLRERGSWKVWKCHLDDSNFIDAKGYRQHIMSNHLSPELQALLPLLDSKSHETPQEEALRKRMSALLAKLSRMHTEVKEECFGGACRGCGATGCGATGCSSQMGPRQQGIMLPCFQSEKRAAAGSLSRDGGNNSRHRGGASSTNSQGRPQSHPSQLYRQDMGEHKKGMGGGRGACTASAHSDHQFKIQEFEFEAIGVIFEGFLEEHTFVRNMVLEPVIDFMSEVLHKSTGGTASSTAQKIIDFQQLLCLHPEQLPLVHEWLTEKVDSLCAQLKSDASKEDGFDHEGALEGDSLGDIDLWSLSADGLTLLVNPKWLQHLQKRLLGPEGTPSMSKEGGDPQGTGLVLEWVYGCIMSTAEKARDSAKRCHSYKGVGGGHAWNELLGALKEQLRVVDVMSRLEAMGCTFQEAERSVECSCLAETPCYLRKLFCSDTPLRELLLTLKAALTTTPSDKTHLVCIGPGVLAMPDAHIRLPSSSSISPASLDVEEEKSRGCLPSAELVLGALRREESIVDVRIHLIHCAEVLREHQKSGLEARLALCKARHERAKGYRVIEQQRGCTGLGQGQESAASMLKGRQWIGQQADADLLRILEARLSEASGKMQVLMESMKKSQVDIQVLENQKVVVRALRSEVELSGWQSQIQEMHDVPASMQPCQGMHDAHVSMQSQGSTALDLAVAVNEVCFTSREEGAALLQQMHTTHASLQTLILEGSTVLSHLEMQLFNVCCDDPGATVGLHLVLPILQRRLDLELAKQQEVCAHKISQALIEEEENIKQLILATDPETTRKKGGRKAGAGQTKQQQQQQVNRGGHTSASSTRATARSTVHSGDELSALAQIGTSTIEVEAVEPLNIGEEEDIAAVAAEFTSAAHHDNVDDHLDRGSTLGSATAPSSLCHPSQITCKSVVEHDRSVDEADSCDDDDDDDDDDTYQACSRSVFHVLRDTPPSAISQAAALKPVMPISTSYPAAISAGLKPESQMSQADEGAQQIAAIRRVVDSETSTRGSGSRASISYCHTSGSVSTSIESSTCSAGSAVGLDHFLLPRQDSKVGDVQSRQKVGDLQSKQKVGGVQSRQKNLPRSKVTAFNSSRHSAAQGDVRDAVSVLHGPAGSATIKQKAMKDDSEARRSMPGSKQTLNHPANTLSVNPTSLQDEPAIRRAGCSGGDMRAAGPLTPPPPSASRPYEQSNTSCTPHPSPPTSSSTKKCVLQATELHHGSLTPQSPHFVLSAVNDQSVYHSYISSTQLPPLPSPQPPPPPVATVAAAAADHKPLVLDHLAADEPTSNTMSSKSSHCWRTMQEAELNENSEDSWKSQYLGVVDHYRAGSSKPRAQECSSSIVASLEHVWALSSALGNIRGTTTTTAAASADVGTCCIRHEHSRHQECLRELGVCKVLSPNATSVVGNETVLMSHHPYSAYYTVHTNEDGPHLRDGHSPLSTERRTSSEVSTTWIPRSTPGGEITHSQPVYGGEITHSQPVYGGEVTHSQPVYGGEVTHSQPVYGGEVTHSQPVYGGEVTHSQPVYGGEVTHSQPVYGGVSKDACDVIHYSSSFKDLSLMEGHLRPVGVGLGRDEVYVTGEQLLASSLMVASPHYLIKSGSEHTAAQLTEQGAAAELSSLSSGFYSYHSHPPLLRSLMEELGDDEGTSSQVTANTCFPTMQTSHLHHYQNTTALSTLTPVRIAGNAANGTGGGGACSESESFRLAFTCPLTKCVMMDPVAASDGYLYERSAIQEVLRSSGIILSPVTGEVMPDDKLVTIIPLQAAIQEWLSTKS